MWAQLAEKETTYFLKKIYQLCWFSKFKAIGKKKKNLSVATLHQSDDLQPEREGRFLVDEEIWLSETASLMNAHAVNV